MTTPFKKLLMIGTSPDTGRIFVELNYSEDGELSLMGIEGPTQRGYAKGSVGQIDLTTHIDELKFADGWSREMVLELAGIWKRWHLNHLRAGSPTQSKFIRERPELFDNDYSRTLEVLTSFGLQPDPENGYRYGSAWLKEDVPEPVLDLLAALPETTELLPGQWGH